MKGRLELGPTSAIVAHLSKFCSDWEHTSKAVVMIPILAQFDRLLIIPKSISFLGEKSWKFVASISISEKGNWRELDSQLYRIMKNWECRVEWKGVLRRQPYFRSSLALGELSKFIPEIQAETNLVDALKYEEEILSSIKRIKPDELEIVLFNPKIDLQGADFAKQYSQFYYSPNSVIWNITLEKYLGDILRGKSFKTTVEGIFSLIDKISMVLQRQSFLTRSNM